jgi:hypothetical protein
LSAFETVGAGAAATDVVTEASLMRICAPLYPSFALESLWTLVLAVFFAYLSILISAKQQLSNPAGAVWKFMCFHFKDWLSDTWRVLSRWNTMHTCDLGQRFRFTRRLNATICRIQVATAILSVTRWLHINNVNGFRYLSYSFTCPLMQAELVLLIAPAVPCYKLQMILIMVITWAVMLSGWYASSLEGDLWTTDWQDVFLDGNFDNLTFKGKAVFPSMAGVLILSMLQMPYMGLLYNCYGGRAEMPEGMNSMIVLTAVSWLGFPIWWLLSYEGLSIIEDTKLNGLGFLILNMVSKGGFTLKMISMVKQFKRKQMLAKQQAKSGRSGSVASLYSLPDLPGDQQFQNSPAPQQRQDRKLPTGQSLADFIRAMKPFDGDAENEFAQKEFEPEKEPLKPTRGSELKNEDLVAEFLKRMDMNQVMASSVEKASRADRPVHTDSDDRLKEQIRKFVLEESDEE